MYLMYIHGDISRYNRAIGALSEKESENKNEVFIPVSRYLRARLPAATIATYVKLQVSFLPPRI